MATTTFVNNVTLTDADWFNDVDRVVYDILNDPADLAALVATLGATNWTITGTLRVDGNTNLNAGTVSAPGLYLESETGTGLYRIGANNHGYAVSGSKVLDISSTGLSVTGSLNASSALFVGTGSSGFTSAVLVSAGADRSIFQAGVNSATNGLTVSWKHATSKTIVNIANIPTSASGLSSGDIWSNSGVLTIV